MGSVKRIKMPSRRIVVTGGNSGIGLALCRQLLVDENCYVYLGSRNADRGIQAVQTILASAPECAQRIEMLLVDTSSAESVAASAERVKAGLPDNEQLYAIVNNAGTGLAHGGTAETVISTNLYGPKRMFEAFYGLLQHNGRVVNVGSGGGPAFVSKASPEVKAVLTNRDVTWEQIEALVAKELVIGGDAYGFSKACLSAYTMALAKEHPNLTVNCVSPGFINTAITKGWGAAKSPEEGTISIKHCLFTAKSTGWYWGSDALRSPLDFMRNPGEPEYQDPLSPQLRAG